ncbi:hypothetical protein B0T26DRAFT_151243 [Lasiosphaeria miniovina]|uniref:Uncharacterized protein n=1 Tax=Lasiosphaeria miniovina TaxID=1954250 RepID=A0AA40B5D0_9PEZI|nr:uncharacterized protein B0T26DRAFT_151243 [Lasiosphaeria miniovina]KAK0727947.1 hypothetical protein B0T26DRAFT_151243 [Lasiosphaeria miniovina]
MCVPTFTYITLDDDDDDVDELTQAHADPARRTVNSLDAGSRAIGTRGTGSRVTSIPRAGRATGTPRGGRAISSAQHRGTQGVRRAAQHHEPHVALQPLQWLRVVSSGLHEVEGSRDLLPGHWKAWISKAVSCEQLWVVWRYEYGHQRYDTVQNLSLGTIGAKRCLLRRLNLKAGWKEEWRVCFELRYSAPIVLRVQMAIKGPHNNISAEDLFPARYRPKARKEQEDFFFWLKKGTCN